MWKQQQEKKLENSCENRNTITDEQWTTIHRSFLQIWIHLNNQKLILLSSLSKKVTYRFHFIISIREKPINPLCCLFETKLLSSFINQQCINNLRYAIDIFYLYMNSVYSALSVIFSFDFFYFNEIYASSGND